MSKVLVIDSSPESTLDVQRSIHPMGHRVEAVPNGRAALERVRVTEPHAILLDLFLPDFTGLQVLHRLRDDGCDVPVAIFTACRDEGPRIEAFRFGADQFLAKPASGEEIAARVEGLLRRAASAANGNGHSHPNTEQFGEVVVDPARRWVTRRGVEVGLRPREFDLLLALLRHRGAVVTRLELLDEVWDTRAGVVTRTIDAHIATLRHKLEDDPHHPKHILTVPKVGYRLELDRAE